jgi:hypothetical protein
MRPASSSQRNEVSGGISLVHRATNGIRGLPAGQAGVWFAAAQACPEERRVFRPELFAFELQLCVVRRKRRPTWLDARRMQAAQILPLPPRANLDFQRPTISFRQRLALTLTRTRPSFCRRAQPWLPSRPLQRKHYSARDSRPASPVFLPAHFASPPQIPAPLLHEIRNPAGRAPASPAAVFPPKAATAQVPLALGRSSPESRPDGPAHAPSPLPPAESLGAALALPAWAHSARAL